MPGEGAEAPKFMEALPPACPPEDAVLRVYEQVWRFVRTNPPSDKDFQSYAGLGKRPPPEMDPCRWASCSLFASKRTAYLFLPKLRNRFRFLARLQITDKCGYTKLTRAHIDFWRFETFKPTILDVERL